MKKFAGCFAALVSVAMVGPASAWGEPGHEVIGSIAEQILTRDHPNTEAQVQALLGGYSLAVAATWADCVRDVQKTADGFVYRPGRYTPAVCQQFQTDAEEARMIDYAQRNWSDCYYSKTEGCHAAYHFADIAVQRGQYDPSYVGAQPYDIVHAIDAAILVLQGQPAPAPFSIADKREALLLIAHFVGDLHQPLHVGAIYLDASGNVVDPDSSADRGASEATRGGNEIMDGSKNLHAEWDDIPRSLGTTASSDLVSTASSTPPSTGQVGDWPTEWASDTVAVSSQAFAGLTFAGAGSQQWTVTEPDGYAAARAQLQTQQLEKAGAHLAEVLAAVLP